MTTYTKSGKRRQEKRTGRQSGVPIPESTWELFLENLTKSPNVSKACENARISRLCAYTRRKNDPAFAADWDRCVTIGWEVCEEEAIRRAVDGVEKPIFSQGKKVGDVIEYSDSLLQFLLRGNNRKYTDRIETINANFEVAAGENEKELRKILLEKLDAITGKR